MDRGERGVGRCGHRGYPVVVGRGDGGRTARCLGCGQSGPVRPSAAWALAALRDEPRRFLEETDRAAALTKEGVRWPALVPSTKGR